MSELKPCPFCGGEARLESYYVRGDGFDAWKVTCDSKQSPIGSMHSTIRFDAMDRDTVVKMWNRRPDRELARQLAEALVIAYPDCDKCEVVGQQWQNPGCEHADPDTTRQCKKVRMFEAALAAAREAGVLP